jgi:hypothetical protein
VFFAQADGLFKSATGQFFFVGTRGPASKPTTARFVEALSTDDLWQAMLSPLCIKHPVNLNANERPAGMNLLNRHQVLHGEVLDYGTRLNGCRVVSLLGYAAFVVRTLKGGRPNCVRRVAVPYRRFRSFARLKRPMVRTFNS